MNKCLYKIRLDMGHDVYNDECIGCDGFNKECEIYKLMIESYKWDIKEDVMKDE